MNHDAAIAHIDNDREKRSWGHVLWTPLWDDEPVPSGFFPDEHHLIIYTDDEYEGDRLYGLPPRYLRVLRQMRRAEAWEDLEPLIEEVYFFDEEDNYWTLAVVVRKTALPAIRRVLERRYRRWRRGQ